MANELTGDFDVVAEFAVGAVNRLLAAMHRIERFPHAMAMRVDDTRRPGLDTAQPSVVGVLDTYGDPVPDQQQIGRPQLTGAISFATSRLLAGLDAVVNFDGLVLQETPIEPSNLKGRAQLQIFPPTIAVTDSTGNNVTVDLEVIARYFADANTAPIAEFVRGDLRITAPVNQVATQIGNTIEIDIKARTVSISFTPKSSSRPLIAEDLAAINLLIRNALKTSFLPSTSALPPGVAHMQFKTINAAQKAIAVLLDMEGGPGNRGSANNVFLGGGDDFAIGVGSDFVRAAFQPTLDSILSTPLEPVSFSISTPIHTWHITYRFTLNSATVDLKNGELVLTLKGHASTSSWPPNFDFTVKASFSLEVDGDTANLVPGDVSIDTSSWIINRFRGRAEGAIRQARDRALSSGGALAAVRKMLSAERNFGGFINSLLQPARQGNAPPLPKGYSLAYRLAEIRTSGIVLHGALSVTDWPAAHVQFEQIPMEAGGRFGSDLTGFNQGPDYSALKTWIPGGVVDSYEWKSRGVTQPGFNDTTRFVFLHQPPVLTDGSAASASTSTPIRGYVPLCLTVHGSRLSPSGAVVKQQVTATVCAVNSFPLFDSGVRSLEAKELTIAVAQPSRGGTVHVAGHASAQSAERGSVAPNLLVHFGTKGSAGSLKVLLEAVKESQRADASTAVLGIFAADILEKIPFVEGVTYSEDQDGKWEKQFGIATVKRPTTLIVSPKGKVVWQHEGEIDAVKLADVLRKSLVAGVSVEPTFIPSPLRIGHPPPNFVFPAGSGRDVTLRKAAGRPFALVFWRSSSRQSIELVRELEKGSAGSDTKTPIVLAINDGEPVEIARSVAKQNGFSPRLVTDSSRRISGAYGINTWPTTVWLDSLGFVAAIRIGRLDGEATGTPFEPDKSASPTQYATAEKGA